MANTFADHATDFALRYFICDDSDSMNMPDCQRITPSGWSTCTRWTELCDMIRFHAEMASVGNIPICVRFLNRTNTYHELNFTEMCLTLTRSPRGGTPLCAAIARFAQYARAKYAEYAYAPDAPICLVLATDGESSDGDIVTALHAMDLRNVSIVVRLLTNDESILAYWHNVKRRAEPLSVEVMGSWKDEAEEVCEKNAWLTYGEPLHRMREFGTTNAAFRNMDTHKLSLDAIQSLAPLFIAAPIDAPDNEDAYLRALADAAAHLPLTYSPHLGSKERWIRPQSDCCTLLHCVIA